MKKILLGTGLVLAALFAIGAKKTLDISDLLGNMKVRLGGINDLSFSGSNITATVDIIISNPTPEVLDISTGSAVKITKVFLHDRNGNQTAYAEPNIAAINIAPFGESLITDIPIHGTLGSVINTLFSGGLKKEDFTVKTEVEVLGRRFII